MTLRPLRHALDDSHLPARAGGSDDSDGVPRETEDDAPSTGPTGHPARRA